MYTTKQLVKISHLILDTLAKMYLARYTELLRRLNNSMSQLQEITQAGKAMGLATQRQWLIAAERSRERMNRDLYVLSNHIQELRTAGGLFYPGFQYPQDLQPQQRVCQLG